MVRKEMSRFKVNGKRGDVAHNVRILLEQDEALRDDKLKTVVSYWYYVDFPKLGKKAEDVNALEFMKMYRAGVLENQASIDRQWQKVQEDNPSLRGKTWEKRQQHSRTVKKDLGYNS
jgi:hypothetical protein